MIHFALSTNGAGHTFEFRKSLVTTIRPRLVLKDGFPSEEEELMKHIAIRTFLSHSKSSTERRLLIMMLPTLDLEATDPIEIRVPNLADIDDPDAYLDALAESFAAGLLSRGIRMWNRSKWNTWSEATCDIGLGLTYNDLYRDAFEPYCAALGKKLTTASARVGGAEALADANADDGADGSDPGEAEPASADAGHNDPAASSKHERAMSHAGKANEFLQHVAPSARASSIALRNVLSSLQRFLGQQSYLTSIEYERTQTALAAKYCADFPGDEHFGKPTREFAIQVLAKGTLEEHATTRLRALLFDSRLWRLVPKRDMTNRFKALTNISINKAGSGMEKHFHFRHSRPPFDNFLLIDQPELAEAVRRRRWCLKDLWSRTFHGNNADLSSLTTRARLICHAKRATPNIIPKECHNAHIRKIVQTRIQTKAFDAPQLAAQLCGQFFRSEHIKSPSFMTKDGDLEAIHKEEPAVVEDDASAEDDKPEAGGSGGPYRAFLRLKRMMSGSESSRLYREFRRDRPEDFADLQQQGKEATERARNGESAFGGSMKELSRQNANRVALAHLQRFIGLEDTERMDAMLTDVLSSDVDVDAGVKALRRVERMASERKRTQDAEGTALVKEYTDRKTPSDVGKFLGDLIFPFNAHLAAALQSSPPPMVGAVSLKLNNNMAANTASAMQQYVQECTQNQTNVGVESERLWGRLTAIVEDFDEDDDTLDNADKNDDDDKCYKAGHCIRHSQAGKQLYTIRNGFLRIMKLGYPSRVVDRKCILAEGRVIARVSRALKRKAGEDVDLAALMEEDWSPLYVSVPDMSFSPYAPMFTEYFEADDHDRECANAADDELALKAFW